MTPEDAIRTASTEHAAQPLVYGTHDCCQFVRRVVLLSTGRDIGAGIEYRGEDEARHILDAEGGLSALMDRLFGARLHPEELQTGDVGLVCWPGQDPAVGVVNPARRVIAPMQSGLETFPMRVVPYGWRA